MLNKTVAIFILISSTAFAGQYSDKFKNFETCVKEALAQSDQFDMPVKSRVDIAELCRGNEASGPITCAKATTSLSSALTPSQVADLCSGAASASPVSCMKETEKVYGMSDSYIGSRENALRLCSRAKDNRSLDCAKELAKDVKSDHADATFRSTSDVAAICSTENN